MDDRVIELGGFKNGFFKRKIYVQETDKEAINNFIRQYNNTDVYSSIYSYQPNIDVEESNLKAPLYLDFDDNDITNNYKEIRREVYQTISFFQREFGIPNDLIKIYFSGNKGFHLLIPFKIFNIKEDNNLNYKYKKLINLIIKEYNLIRLDSKIYDKKRLFRIPYSINSKSGLKKIQITLNYLMSHNFNDLINLSKLGGMDILNNEPYPIERANRYFNYLFTPVKTKQFNKHFKYNHDNKSPLDLFPCISAMLDTSAEEGKRNNTAITLCSCLFQSHIEYEEIIDIMLEWNKNNNPPLDERELLNTIDSAKIMHEQNRYYGCGAIKDLGMCIENCKLNK